MMEYEQGKARLVEYVKRLCNPPNLTERRKQAEDLAKRLEALADELDDASPIWFDLECEHDRPPERVVAVDGMPVLWPDFRCSFKGTLGYMRDLAESARRVAESYPNPRKRPALPFAATGFVWLRREFGFPLPSLYEAGEDVLEFDLICKAAGIFKSPITLRNALSAALKEWENDRHMQPTWVHYVLTGSW